MNINWRKVKVMKLAIVMVIVGIAGLLVLGGSHIYAAETSKWVKIGGAGFSVAMAEYTDLFITDDGTLYVAFKDTTGNASKATVKKYHVNENIWETVGGAGFSAGKADYISLDVYNGTPYVAYKDGGNANRATVMMYNASENIWETVGSAGFSTGTADHLSLDVYNGTPYVSYSDGGKSYKATVMKYEGGSWGTVGSAGLSANVVGETSLYVDNGTPYLAYRDDGSFLRATVMKYEGGSWNPVGSPSFSSGSIGFLSLDVYNGTPYVAFRDDGYASKATVMMYNDIDNRWENVGVPGFTAGQADYTSLDVYNGTPYVAYMDVVKSNKATVMKYNGSSWETVRSAGFTAGAALSTSLYVYDDIPYVAYSDAMLSGMATVMGLKYTVVYDGNGNTAGNAPIDSRGYDKNAIASVLGKPGNMVKTGHTFAGWNTAANGTGTNYDAGDTLDIGTTGATLFAMWTINSYTVDYDDNGSTGGGVPAGSSHNYNTSATVVGNTGNLVKAGHTFTGWNTAADGTGTNYGATDTFTIGLANVRLFAKWAVNSYTVSFYSNGGSAVDNQTVVYGQTASEPTDPTKTGYTFDGWNADEDLQTPYSFAAAIGAADVTLYAKWTIISYTVAYDGNGNDEGSPPVASSHDYSTSVTVLSNTGSLEKMGYTFAGWNTNSDGSGSSYVATNAFTIGAGDVTLYAKWAINSYEVSFESNGGSAVDNQTVVYGQTASEPTDPTKTGYTFDGWNADEDLQTPYSFAAAIGAADVTLYAKWMINSYTVSYDDNGSDGGSAPDGSSHEFDTSVVVPGNTGSLEKTGYTFAGWNTAADGSGSAYAEADAFTIGAGDVTLYAKWAINSYEVSFESNGGSAIDNQTVVYGHTASEPTDPTKTGYTFDGWNADEDLQTPYSFAAAIGAADVTLYAKWMINSYTVSYDDNGSDGGSAPDGSSHEFDTSVVVPGNTGSLEKTGYTFAGWNTAADGSGSAYAEADAFTIGAEDVTLYAKWAINSYEVTYDDNGSDGGSAPDGSSHDYNTSVNVPGNTGSLEKIGHAFAGWNTAANGNGTSYGVGDTFDIDAADLTLYAMWTINNYNVTYDDNGSTGGSAQTDSSHVYNTIVTVPGNGSLVKTGHTFYGWNTEADGSGTDYAETDEFTIGAADVTLYAKWAVNSYTVLFESNGGSIVSNQSVVYGQTASEPSDPTKTGFTFVEWYADEDLQTPYSFATPIGAADVTLFAKWNINSYTVSYDGNGSTGGSEPTGSSYDYDTSVTVQGNSGNLERTGHTFAGWNTAATGSGTAYGESDMFAIGAAGVTLYAKWTVNSYTIAYNGNDSIGGSMPSGSSYDYNSTVTVPGNTGNLEKSGYTFAGWNTAANGSGMSYGVGDTFSMGAYNIMLYAQWLSNNALLSNLFVDQELLSPAFSPANLNYYVDLEDYTESSLSLSFVQADSTQSVSVTGAVYQSVTNEAYSYQATSLIVGSTPIEIEVTAQDGTSNVYTITVNRVSGSDADLSGLSLSSGGTLGPVFTPGTTSYVSSVANGVSNLTVTAIASDFQAAITINGQPIISGQASDAIHLDVGNNTINIEVIARDETTIMYTVIVKRASNDSGSGGSGGSGGITAPTPTSSSDKVTSINGQLTLPSGINGEVSLGDEVFITIPTDAADKELKITIEKVLNTQNLINNNEVLASSIYEIMKNFTESFNKPVTLTLSFEPTSLKSNQEPVIFYYDEVNKTWVEIDGGQVNGNRITVIIDHFTKFAVFAVDKLADVPSTNGGPKINFSDISEHWAEDNIKQAVSAGIVTGYSDETFKPNQTVTRAEFSFMLIKALNLQGEEASLAFSDTERIGSWARQAVAQAVQAGIIKGFKDGSFRPSAQITRSEMAVMTANAIGQSIDSNTVTRFSDDKNIPKWAKGAVGAIQKLGLVEGKGSNEFDPLGRMTRAEAITVLLKMLAMKSK